MPNLWEKGARDRKTGLITKLYNNLDLTIDFGESVIQSMP